MPKRKHKSLPVLSHPQRGVKSAHCKLGLKLLYPRRQILYVEVKNTRPSSLLQPSKMPKGKMSRGRKWPQTLPIMRKQKAKKVLNPLRKGLRTWALGRTSSPKEISLASSDGPATPGCSDKGFLYVSEYFLLLSPLVKPEPTNGYPAA